MRGGPCPTVQAAWAIEFCNRPVTTPTRFPHVASGKNTKVSTIVSLLRTLTSKPHCPERRPTVEGYPENVDVRKSYIRRQYMRKAARHYIVSMVKRI
ncbi:hypothetical protein C8Q73DRAFT_81148 [Cubamyces lactineus]|nr:hypothetical protein C8Q73DRAFT_81148 [Cubamyces lactineus]